MGGSIMRDLFDILTTIATRTMHALIITVMLIGFTFYNMGSFSTIQHFGFSQYLNNILTLQLWDVQYKIKKTVKFYDEPVPLMVIDYLEQYKISMGPFEPTLFLRPGNIINVSGTYTPDGGEVDWLAAEVYVDGEPRYGYVLAPGGSMGLFGGFVNSDEYFDQFDVYDEKKYENILAQEFYDEIKRSYIIIVEADRIEKQKLAELGIYKKISTLFPDEILYKGVRKYSDEYFNRDFYCRKDDYKAIKQHYNHYFKDNYYPRLLNIHNRFES